MKKLIIALLLAAVIPLSAFATDANQMKYVEILPAQASVLEVTDLALLPVSGVTTAAASVTVSNDVSTYEGYGVVVMGYAANVAATTTLTVSYGYTALSSTTTVLTVTTQTTTTAKFESYEFDFDTTQGTNAALWLSTTLALVDGDETAYGGSVLAYNAARANQTNTGTGVDISAYKGNATLWVQSGGAVNEATAYTNLITFQHAAASTCTYVTVTNLAGTAGTFSALGATATNFQYAIDLSRLHPYVRVTSVQQGDVSSVGATLIAPMKSE